jgi:hypothetical protein
MKTFCARLATAAVALLAFAVNSARADFVAWTYNWSRSPVAVGSGTGGLTLTDEPVNHADGTSDIVATNIRSFSSASRSHPDNFSSAAYTLTLSLKDNASGASANMTFAGFFSGTLSATSANITNVFTGTTSYTRVLGDHTYTVTIGSYAPPGPPTASNAGSIGAHVSVDEFTGGGGSNNAPEPTSLLLATSGLSMLGAGAWRKWRRKMKVIPATV